MLPNNLFIFYVMTAIVALLIGLAKGGLGGTLAVLAVPLMTLVMPPEEVLGLVLPILMFADIFAVALHWGNWSMKLVLLLIPGSIVGVTLGTWVITSAPTRMLQIGIGIIVLIFAVYKLFEKRIIGSPNYHRRNWHGLLAGTITGFSSSLAHTGAPPVSIYLLLQDLTPEVFVATSAIFFFILNWIKVPYYLFAGLFNWHRLWQVALLAPLLPIGVWMGKRLANRVNKETFEKIIIALLVLGAILLIVG